MTGIHRQQVLVVPANLRGRGGCQRISRLLFAHRVFLLRKLCFTNPFLSQGLFQSSFQTHPVKPCFLQSLYRIDGRFVNRFLFRSRSNKFPIFFFCFLDFLLLAPWLLAQSSRWNREAASLRPYAILSAHFSTTSRPKPVGSLWCSMKNFKMARLTTSSLNLDSSGMEIKMPKIACQQPNSVATKYYSREKSPPCSTQYP